MKNFKFSRLFVAALVVACLALTGCKPQTEEVLVEKIIVARPIASTDKIIGSWISTYGEKYEVSSSEFKNYYGTSECYTGDNVYVAETSETSGYIYFKYTKAFCYAHSDFDNFVYTYDDDAPDVGKWYALYYSDLTDSSVKISGAAGEKSSCDTLKEAIETFTVANGYMSTITDGKYSACTKE